MRIVQLKFNILRLEPVNGGFLRLQEIVMKNEAAHTFSDITNARFIKHGNIIRVWEENSYINTAP